MKKQIEIIPSESPNVFRIGKKIFLLKEEVRKKDGHIKKLLFEEINKKDYIHQVKKLAKTIRENNELDRQTILEQALLSLSKEDLNKVEKGIIKKKANLKKGCLNINIDGLEVPIFSRASFLD